MADANPSRPGSNELDRATSRMETAVPIGVEVGINKDNRVVQRTTLSNGNIIENHVFPGDYPDAKRFAEPKSDAAKKVASDRKAKKSGD